MEGTHGIVPPHGIAPACPLYTHHSARWSDKEMQYQAKNIASGLLQNCGHNCVALEVGIGGGGGEEVWGVEGGRGGRGYC